MDRRSEPRIRLEEQACITLLGESEIRSPATVTELSGRGMKLRVPRQLVPNTPVKVEVGDSMYFGEICYCRLELGTFFVGLRIEQVLTGLQGLAQLRRRLTLDSTMRAQVDKKVLAHALPD